MNPFRRFATELGVLFQIVDDILDVTGTDDALGKPRGSDERHGKRTYVSEFGIERARELAAESHEMALGSLAEAAKRAPVAVGVGGAQPGRSDTDELQQITDFIYTRTS
jgi:geranylgeranyl diphosphate synthase type II